MRASSLPRFLTCPSSALSCDHPYEPPNEAAGLGSAVHECMAAHVSGAVPVVDRIAAEHNCDAEEVERLFGYGRAAWLQLGPTLREPAAEHRFEGDQIQGTADVFNRGGTTEPHTVIDWKTNRVKRSYRDQLVGYAAAAVDCYGWPESGQVQIVLVWLQFREIEIQNVHKHDVETLRQRVADAWAEVGKRYAPGDACTFCPRQLVCRAKNEYLHSAARALTAASAVEVTRETLMGLWERSRQLRRALDNYDAALRAELQTGPITDADGCTMSLKEVTVDRIKAEQAWSVLVQSGFTNEDLANCVSMSKTQVLSVAASRAKRGEKGVAKAELLQRLRSNGAIEESRHHRIKLERESTL